MKYFLKYIMSIGGFRFLYGFYKFMILLVPVKAHPKSVVFVLGNDGWILEKIAKVIGKSCRLKVFFSYSVVDLPDSSTYFFMHYRLLIAAYRRNPSLLRRHVFLWFTHPSMDYYDNKKELIYLLNGGVHTFSASSCFRSMLVNDGVFSGNVSVELGGVDRSFVRGLNSLPPRISESSVSPVVGLCSAFYPRKEPDKLLALVRKNPDIEFRLLGKNWNLWDSFDDLIQLDNFEYVELPYNEYPVFYRSIDIFLSLSSLEGGPIPLIEAMYANVFPVTSDTGFARDIIKHRINGLLFPVTSDVFEISSLIRTAISDHRCAEVASSVASLTWESFASKVTSKMFSVTRNKSTTIIR